MEQWMCFSGIWKKKESRAEDLEMIDVKLSTGGRGSMASEACLEYHWDISGVSRGLSHCVGFPGKPPHLGVFITHHHNLVVHNNALRDNGVQDSKENYIRAPPSPNSSWLKSFLISSSFQLACGRPHVFMGCSYWSPNSVFTHPSSLCLNPFILLHGCLLLDLNLNLIKKDLIPILIITIKLPFLTKAKFQSFRWIYPFGVGDIVLSRQEPKSCFSS